MGKASVSFQEKRVIVQNRTNKEDFMTDDQIIELLTDFLFKKNEEYGFRRLAKEDAEELFDLLYKNDILNRDEV